MAEEVFKISTYFLELIIIVMQQWKTMKNTKLIVNTKSKNYPIYFGNNILNKTGKLIKKDLPDVRKICVISDKKLPMCSLTIL